jgi:heat shock protein HslJ
MKINRTMIGMTILTLVGIGLSACASSPSTETGDQVSRSESVEKTIYVAPLLVDCQGEGPQKCMLVKENQDDEYSLFYDQIEGFDYEEGFEYKLVVQQEQVENPPAGASSFKWSLLRVENKQPVPVAGESVEKTVYVGPELVDCVGVAPQKCMLVKENPEDEYTFFYDQIEGFDYEEGYEYKLIISEEQVENPPADASSIKWTLVSIESKKPVASIDAPRFEGTDWVLVSYLNQEGELTEALSGTNTTAQFQNNQVNGIAGCNNYFGSYEIDGDKIRVSSLASTEMFCGNPTGVMDQEIAYLAALGSAATYTIEQGQLILANADGETVLIYNVAEPQSLVGNLWQVISYNNGKDAVVSVIMGTEITAVFDEEGQLSGSAGCNNYSAPYSVDGDTITIGSAVTTRKACNEPEGIMDQEMEYLAALEMATNTKFADGRLTFLDADGHQVVNFQPARTFKLSETIWHLQSYYDGSEANHSIVEGSIVTAFFDIDGVLTGTAGCNNYSGDYQVEGDRIKVNLGPLTMMFCGEPEGLMDQEEAYLKALASVTGYRIVGDVLVMQDESGQEVLQFKASDLVGYVWMWLEFLENNDTLTQPDNPGNYTLEFLPDGVVNLQADCNSASGLYSVNGNQLDIDITATSLALCPPESLSEKFIQLLNDSVAYTRQGDYLFIDIMMDTGTMKFLPQ